MILVELGGVSAINSKSLLKVANSCKIKLRNLHDKLICLIHYPPFNVRKEPSLFTKLFEEFKVDKVVYGHLHGKGVAVNHRINFNGVEYVLTSCDLVDNKLVEILLT